jgi:outer membrane protein assembly factor BamB
MTRSPVRLLAVAAAFVALGASVSPAAVTDAVIHVSKSVGPPTSRVDVSGSGFGVSETVDVDFDTTLVGMGTTDPSGVLPAITIQVPSPALPGSHTITATGETSGLSASLTFHVRTDWAQFMFGPQRGGQNPYENVLSPDNVGGLVELWAGNIGYSSFGGPVVYKGIVYVASADENMYAFDAQTGGLTWKVRPGGELQGDETPAVWNGIVYLSASPSLHAMDARNGQEVWSAPLGSRTSPAVANGVVYVTTIKSVWALDALTGAPLWTVSTPNGISTSPAVVDGVVYVVDADKVLALDASSGTVLWMATVAGAVFTGSPAISGGMLYVGSRDDLYALNTSDGSVAWTGVTGGDIFASPAVANGKVFIGSYDKKLYAFDAETGAVMWTGRTGGTIYSSAAVANGVVYVTTNDLFLYAFRVSNGKGLAKLSLNTCGGAGSPESSSPAVANGRVFVGSVDSCLHVFGLA